MQLNVSDIFLRRLSDLCVLESKLWTILDEESHKDSPMLPVRDVVAAYKRIKKHGDSLD
jgi:hypothetical protein